ncbi:MAG: glucan biosynthesis protein G [Rhodospirillaceae bacterium]
MNKQQHRSATSRWLARLLAIAGWSGIVHAYAFDFEDVAKRAQELAAAPYKKPEGTLPKSLQSLTYDQYRDIRYKPDRSLWREEKLPFEVAFFHQGFYFNHSVKINEIVGKRVHPIRFDASAFDYGANAIDRAELRNVGFAGFRVHYPVNTPKYKDEVLVFLGASYLRALGKGQRYGASARALAIDTGLQSGEEFPRFVEFWLERPVANARRLVIYALLDSPRGAGAYRFVLRPGTDTVIEVKTRVYVREHVAKLGLAPVTTMFMAGENQRSPGEDYRPEVHDSDGLSIQSGTGEWLWRPLVNPRRLLITSFSLTNPLGFGLMQRDRSFQSYEDLESHYELRPSIWVEPVGKWGEGRVELVQIPTPDETHDNIVAFWVPTETATPKSPLTLEYRLHWQMEDEKRPPLSWVMQTRRGLGYVRKPDNSIGYTVDFVGPVLRKLPPDAKIESVVTIDGNGEVVENNTYPNEVTGGWRMALRIRRVDEKKPVELRAYLRLNKETISETWSYIIPPN